MPDDRLPIIVFGAGAHGVVLIEALALTGRSVQPWLADDSIAVQGKSIDGRAVHPAKRILEFDRACVELVNGVGSTGLPTARRRVYERFAGQGYRFIAVTHPSAIVSPSANICAAAQLMAGCVVQAHATIGLNTIINTRTSIDHDCVIGAHCHLAPGVTLSGNVTVGQGSHLGPGAVVIQGVTIGPGAFVAAGAVVTRDLPPNAQVRGVPARPFD